MNEIIIFCAAYLIYIACIYVFLRIVLLHKKEDRITNLLAVFASAVASWTLGHFLKDLFAHARPDLTVALIVPIDPYSFPSGHSSFMFALAFAMYLLDKHAGKIILVLATAVGIARVLAGVHYWYDIVGGMALGAFVAYVIVRVIKNFRRQE